MIFSHQVQVFLFCPCHISIRTIHKNQDIDGVLPVVGIVLILNNIMSVEHFCNTPLCNSANLVVFLKGNNMFKTKMTQYRCYVTKSASYLQDLTAFVQRLQYGINYLPVFGKCLFTILFAPWSNSKVILVRQVVLS